VNPPSTPQGFGAKFESNLWQPWFLQLWRYLFNGANGQGGPGFFTSSLSAWTPFNSAVFSTGGLLTATTFAGRYLTIGKTCFFFVSITINNNGTGSGFIGFTLPVPARVISGGVVSGRANAISGKTLQGFVSGGSASTMVVSNYDNSYPAATGEVLILEGVYETA
jgi:hypothetical protein